MESFIKNMLEAPDPKPKEFVEGNMNYFQKESFDTYLKYVDRMVEHDVYNFIKSNIDYIAKLIMENNVIVSRALMNVKFLRPFSQVIAGMPITYLRQLCANKICYDYFTSEVNDPVIRQIVFDMSKAVNRNEIQQLMAIGLDIDTASNLALCRHSSMNEVINIKRLNFVICSKDPDIMTEQMIVWIYEKLFDSISDLFNTTMLEPYYVPTDEIDNGSEFMEIFSTISLAILTIVNNMTLQQIHQVISGYVTKWNDAKKPHVRVSLHSLSADFGRIQTIVENLESQGIVVP